MCKSQKVYYLLLNGKWYSYYKFLLRKQKSVDLFFCSEKNNASLSWWQSKKRLNYMSVHLSKFSALTITSQCEKGHSDCSLIFSGLNGNGPSILKTTVTLLIFLKIILFWHIYAKWGSMVTRIYKIISEKWELIQGYCSLKKILPALGTVILVAILFLKC